MQARTYRLAKATLRGGRLALSGSFLLLAVACGGDEPGALPGDDDDQTVDEDPVTDGDDDTDVGDDDTDVGDDDTDVGDDDTDVGDDDDEPVKPSVDAGKADASTSAPKPDGGPAPGNGGKDSGTPAGDGGSSTPSDDGGSKDPGPGEGPVSGDSSCLNMVTEYGAKGPFQYAAKHSGSVKIWVPETPAGCKVPIVHLANGTGASCSNYQSTLNSLASHGFLTTCYENANTGAGTQGLMAFETVMKNHADKYIKAYGSLGHSQGGQSSYIVQARAEEKFGLEGAKYAGLAMQPASGFGTQPGGGTWQQWYAKIKSPMFMFSGTSDALVSEGWVRRGFDALADGIEAYHWSCRGSTHIPTPQAETTEVGVPWLRWKLLGDKKACMAFKALKMGGGKWREVQVQKEAQCD